MHRPLHSIIDKQHKKLCTENMSEKPAQPEGNCIVLSHFFHLNACPNLQAEGEVAITLCSGGSRIFEGGFSLLNTFALFNV